MTGVRCEHETCLKPSDTHAAPAVTAQKLLATARDAIVGTAWQARRDEGDGSAV
ncbi:MAG TPA: hypothetical protein VIM63_08505 [Rhodoferax sp.]